MRPASLERGELPVSWSALPPKGLPRGVGWSGGVGLGMAGDERGGGGVVGCGGVVGGAGAVEGVGGPGVGDDVIVTGDKEGSGRVVGGGVFGFGMVEGREEDGLGGEVGLGYVGMD